jgi:hypothetical protein
MKSFKISLIASLIATGLGWWVWELRLAHRLWPDHPQLADFFIVLAAAIIIQIAWPAGWLSAGKGRG